MFLIFDVVDEADVAAPDGDAADGVGGVGPGCDGLKGDGVDDLVVFGFHQG